MFSACVDKVKCEDDLLCTLRSISFPINIFIKK